MTANLIFLNFYLLDPAPNPTHPNTCAGTNEWIYTVVLELEDATAKLYGRLIGADGERFFQGMPPVNLEVCED